MKSRKLVLLIVAVLTVCWFPVKAEARIGDRLRARRAAKQSCPSGICTNPATTGTTGTQRVGVNSKDGITGRFSDAYYADHFAKKSASAVVVPTPAKPAEVSIVVEPTPGKAPTANGGHVTESARAPVVPAPAVPEAAGTSNKELAAAAVELNREALSASEDALVVATKAAEREKVRLAASLDEQIAELQQQRAALEPTPEE